MNRFFWQGIKIKLFNLFLYFRFCSECRTKVLLASSLLTTTETDPTKEKGYVSSLYADIKRCTGGHVHLPLNIEYISSIIGRAQPELMGRYVVIYIFFNANVFMLSDKKTFKAPYLKG